MNQKLEQLNRLKSAKNDFIKGQMYNGIIKLENVYGTNPELPNKSQYEANKEMFRFMIEYFAKDTPDTQRNQIYEKIRTDFLLLTDKLKEYYKAYQQTDSTNIYSRYHQKIDYLSVLQDLNNHKEKTETVFVRIWLTNQVESDFVSIMSNFYESTDVSSEQKSMITSAITLSLFRFFDIKKLNILFEVYMLQIGEPSIRALVGIVLTLLIHENLTKFYPEIKENIARISNIEDTDKNFEYVFIQILKSQNTENLIKTFNEDILPQVQQMQGDFMEEFDFEDFSSENMMDDENPGWENYFDKNPEFFEKIEEFSMQQFEGSDVFSATLGNLKNFAFFNKASSWFIPFSANNQEIRTMLTGTLPQETLDKFLDSFEKAFYFCNSDKFSFCLHIHQIATPMREMAINMLVAEIESSQELVKDQDALGNFDLNKGIIVRYVQDLYRFYNFNKNFKGFKNIFTLDIGLHKSDIFSELPNYDSILRSCAELAFYQKFYNQSCLIFEKLISNGANDANIYEKVGFSYQKLKHFELALKNYQKAEFFEYNKKWLYKKIGFSYIKLENYAKALEYYEKAEQLDPEDTGTLMFIGRCNIALKNYQEALKKFFKYDFFNPDDAKATRSIAFCSMMLQKFEQSEKYLLKTIEIEPSKFDFLSLGNIFWIKKDKKEAIKYYITATKEYENFDEFKKEYNDNKHILEEQNIDPFDINLMLDFLQMKSYNL